MFLKKGFFDPSLADAGLAMDEAGPGGGAGGAAGAAGGDVTATLGASRDNSWLAAGVLP